MQETEESWVRSLGQEDPLEKGMATHSSVLGWRIPQTEEPGRLQSIGSQRVGHDWSNLAQMSHLPLHFCAVPFAWIIRSVALPFLCSRFCFSVFWNPHCRRLFPASLFLCHELYSSDTTTFICLYPGCFFHLTHSCVMSLSVSLFWPVIWPLKKI